MQDRANEARRRKSFAPMTRDQIARFASKPPPVLNYLPCLPAARLGGIPLQLIARLSEESRDRAIALMYPLGDRYRLELQDGERRGSIEFDGAELPLSPFEMIDERFEALVAQVLGELQINTLHLEGAAEVPFESVARLQKSGVRVLLSIHDFSLFCARPHLLEHPAMGFCDYSVDLNRCRNCLSESWKVQGDTQFAYRQAAARMLEGAAAVIYPSQFMRDRFGEIFRAAKFARECVIEPAIKLPPYQTTGRTAPPKHIAIVGAVSEAKGSRIIEKTIAKASQLMPGTLRWSVTGGGDVEVLTRLRANGVALEGYYRAGTLTSLLQRRTVDIALMLSIVPESFGLTLSECWAAGVPVIAFDHGAVAERVRAHGGGRLVQLADGSEGIARAVEAVVSGRERIPSIDPDASLANPRAAAEAYRELYRELGL
jgi:hypothetical protein